MVKAILEGRKTVTRRVLTLQPDNDCYFEMKFENGFAEIDYNQGNDNPKVKCPYGKVGDILWVREEHYRFGHWEKDDTKKRKSGRQAWKFVAVNNQVLYFDSAPAEFRKGRHHKDPETNAWYKRLARFMPKSACHTKLRIKSIGVERLQDITEEDAVREGITPVESFDSGAGISGRQMYMNYLPFGYMEVLPKDSFESLWTLINGKESWDSNPWVWRLEFTKL